jgi:hypothetical protein
MRKLVLGFAMAMAAQPALAANWQMLGTSYGRTVFIDADSYRRVGLGILAWDKLEASGVVLKKSLWLHDCDSGRASLRQGISYLPSGAVQGSYTYDAYKWEYPAPESILEGLHKAVCAKR